MVGEQQQPGDQGEPERPQRPGTAQHPLQREDPEQHQQHHQGIRAGLGGVPHQPRVHRRQDQGDRAGSQAPAQQVEQRQGGGEHPGQGAHRRVAGADEPCPAVQQQVVERWRAVSAQRGDEFRRGSRAIATLCASSSHSGEVAQKRDATPVATTSATSVTSPAAGCGRGWGAPVHTPPGRRR